MLDNISDFFGGVFLKFIPHMPVSNFDYDDYIESLDSTLAHVNYFIPFYLFAPITIGWVTVLIASFAILILIRWIKGSV